MVSDGEQKLVNDNAFVTLVECFGILRSLLVGQLTPGTAHDDGNFCCVMVM